MAAGEQPMISASSREVQPVTGVRRRAERTAREASISREVMGAGVSLGMGEEVC